MNRPSMLHLRYIQTSNNHSVNIPFSYLQNERWHQFSFRTCYLVIQSSRPVTGYTSDHEHSLLFVDYTISYTYYLFIIDLLVYLFYYIEPQVFKWIAYDQHRHQPFAVHCWTYGVSHCTLLSLLDFSHSAPASLLR